MNKDKKDNRDRFGFASEEGDDFFDLIRDEVEAEDRENTAKKPKDDKET